MNIGENWLLSRKWGADVCEYKYMIIRIYRNPFLSHFIQCILERTDFWADNAARMCAYIDVWLQTLSQIGILVILYNEY